MSVPALTPPVVAILHPFPETIARIVRTSAGNGLALRFASAATPEALQRAIADADYAVVYATPLTRDILHAARRLKLIHKWGVGVDNIDLDAAHELGVPVARTTGRNAGTVAELTIGLMLAITRHIVRADAGTRTGGWPVDALWLSASSLAGKTVGLVGFGHIGQAVARRLAGFECRVVHARRTEAGTPASAPSSSALPLHELLASADIVSLHLPLTTSTRHLIDRAALGLMKPSAVLVNTARGDIVNEQDLIRALSTGTIAGAALDVFAQEPVDPANPLLRMDNVVVTPHMGGKTRDNLVALVAHWARNLQQHAAGVPIPAIDLVSAA